MGNDPETPRPPAGPGPSPGPQAPTLGDAVLGFVVVWTASSLGTSQLMTPANRQLFSYLELVWAESLMVAVAGAAAAWFLVGRRTGWGLVPALRLHWPGARWAAAAGGVGLALGLCAAAAGRFGEAPAAGRVDDPLGVALCGLYLLLGPFGEEAYYRGLLLPALAGRFGANAGLAILTVGHATLLALFATNAAVFFVLAFTAELGLGLLRLLSRSLWPSLIANWLLTAVYYLAMVEGS